MGLPDIDLDVDVDLDMDANIGSASTSSISDTGESLPALASCRAEGNMREELVARPLGIKRLEEEIEEVSPMLGPPAGRRGRGLLATVSSAWTGCSEMTQELSWSMAKQL